MAAGTKIRTRISGDITVSIPVVMKELCVCAIRVRSASYGDERKEKEESGYLNVRRAPVESKIEKLTLPCWPVVYFPFSQEKGEERTY